MWASVRNGTDQASWTTVVETNIPDGKSNLNAGPLPDGRVYLAFNPNNPQTSDNRRQPQHAQISARDPVCVATTSDGVVFDAIGVAITCTDLSAESKCLPRFEGKSKNAGPSYPQALTVVAPAPEELRGFYVASSNNKEDIWMVKVTPPNAPSQAWV